MKTVAKLLFCSVPIPFGIWAILCIWKKSIQVIERPDANGDGRFTILDIPNALLQIFLEVGNQYQEILCQKSIGIFLEMSVDPPNLFWSLALASFTYWFGFFGPFILWKEDVRGRLG